MSSRVLTYALCTALFFTGTILSAQPMTDSEGDVGIGTNSPDPSALVDMTSTTSGFLMPRMTTAQRDLIPAPAEGLMIYNTDLGVPQTWSDASGGFQWDAVLTSGSNYGWLTDGNGGLVDGTNNFLGTLDATRVRMVVNGTERLVLNTNGSLQRDLGGDARGGNAIDLQVVRGIPSQVASGDASFIGGGRRNTASGEYSTLGGGTDNRVAADIATISGGFNNVVSGPGATIGGGNTNIASNNDAVVAGGIHNVASGRIASVGGGGRDTASGFGATVAGGEINRASGPHSTISGGINNDASGPGATIGGGSTNIASDNDAVVAGGIHNVASGRIASVGGGGRDTASGFGATVAGGEINRASGPHSTISGGINNDASGPGATIGGGSTNIASDNDAVVAGGIHNVASGRIASVGGGGRDTASGFGATVAGGELNRASGNHSTVSGGLNNEAAPIYGTVGGGNNNRVGSTGGTVGGGQGNVAVFYATVGGGLNNQTGSTGTVAGGFENNGGAFGGAVGGGGHNVAGSYGAIPGGRGLSLSGGSFGFLGGNPSVPVNAFGPGVRPMSVATPDVAVFGNTDLWLANNDNAASQLRFYESNNTTGNFPAGTNFTSFEAGAQAADINYILPTVAPVAGQILSASSVVGTTVTLTWVADDIGVIGNKKDEDNNVPTAIAASGGEDQITVEDLLKIIQVQSAEIETLKRRLDVVAPEKGADEVSSEVSSELTLEATAD